jgi:hypothetical protein
MTLGRRWTTRIIAIPGDPLLASGPYRFLSQPNYFVVLGEIAALPLCLGLPCLLSSSLLGTPPVLIDVIELLISIPAKPPRRECTLRCSVPAGRVPQGDF